MWFSYVATNFSQNMWTKVALSLASLHALQNFGKWSMLCKHLKELQWNLNYPDLVYLAPQLSGQTCSTLLNALICMCRGCDWWLLGEWPELIKKLECCRGAIAQAKTDWSTCLYECYWPWLSYIHIIKRLGTINSVRKLSISVIWTVSLIHNASIKAVAKGVLIIEVPLYFRDFREITTVFLRDPHK